MINKVFQLFLEKKYPYNYKNGPEIIRDKTQALSAGLNCIALMHLLIKELFEFKLPKNLRGWEMYSDNPFLIDVSLTADLKIGDILFFGKKNLPVTSLKYKPKYDSERNLINEQIGNDLIGDDYAGVHLAMYIGEKDTNTNPLLIHTGKIDNTVSVWPLSKFLSYEQYAVLHKTKRFNVSAFSKV